LKLREDELRNDERAPDEAAPHDVRDPAVDDDRGIEQDTSVRGARATNATHALRERAQLVPLDRPCRRSHDTEHHRRDQRCVAPYVTGEKRERKREKEREHETDGGPERTADEVARRCRADPFDDDGRGHDRDVWRAEPSQDRAGRRQKKNDEDLVVGGRDLGDLEERGAEEESENEANECCHETDEGHDDSFPC